MANHPRQQKTWQRILSVEDLPEAAWIRKIAAENPEVLARISEASKIGLVTIAARWDRGNAWNVWHQKEGSGWWHSEEGMHSQMPVQVFLSAHRVWQKKDGSWGEADFPEEEIGWVSFWDWEERVDEMDVALEQVRSRKIGRIARNQRGVA